MYTLIEAELSAINPSTVYTPPPRKMFRMSSKMSECGVDTLVTGPCKKDLRLLRHRRQLCLEYFSSCSPTRPTETRKVQLQVAALLANLFCARFEFLRLSRIGESVPKSSEGVLVAYACN